MIILLLLVSLTLSASKNQFIAVRLPDDFETSQNFFGIPSDQGGKNLPGQPGGLASEDIQAIRLALRNKQALLLFPDSSSITYFLEHVIKASEIRNQSIKNAYNELFTNIDKRNQNNDTLFPLEEKDHIPITFYNYLLISLEQASNSKAVIDGSNYIDDFFSITVQVMQDINQSNPVMTSSQYKPVTTSNPAGTNTPSANGGILNYLKRLKRAFIFEWKTFRIPKTRYSEEQRKERQTIPLDDTYTVINLGAYAMITTLFFLGVGIKKIFNSRTSWFK